MALKGQKNFNVNINEQLADIFSDLVDKHGYTKYRAIEGALRAFMALPADLQVKLMSGDIKDISDLIEPSKTEIKRLWTNIDKIAKKVGVKLKK